MDVQCSSNLDDMTQLSFSSSQELSNGLRHFASFEETVTAGVTTRTTEACPQDAPFDALRRSFAHSYVSGGHRCFSPRWPLLRLAFPAQAEAPCHSPPSTRIDARGSDRRATSALPVRRPRSLHCPLVTSSETHVSCAGRPSLRAIPLTRHLTPPVLLRQAAAPFT